MRRFLIVFFSVFTLTMNYFATGLLAAAEQEGVSPTTKAKEILGLGEKKEKGLSAKEVEEVVFRSEKLADEFYRFRSSDMGDVISEIIKMINNGTVLEDKTIESTFPELIELKLKEDGEIVIAGRLWVDDIFQVKHGDKTYYMQAPALRNYFLPIMETKIPTISPEKVILQENGQRIEEVIGSLELNTINKDINKIIKPVMTDADRTKLAWTQEELQAILANPANNYYDIYLTYTLYYNDIAADRIIVFLSGEQQNKVVFANKALSEGLVLHKK